MPASLAPSKLFRTEEYDPERAREGIRGTLAAIAIVVFLLVVLAYIGFAAEAQEDTWNRIKEAMGVILPAVTSVLGTVLGFYFGSQRH